jgi:Zn-dependent protease with chaperone function
VNFFDAQDQAKNATRWLVVVYFAATALIVAGVTAVVGALLYQNGVQANPSVLGITAILTAMFILGATLYKTAILSGGGGRVAQDMGGTLVPSNTQDPLHRRLRNIVEEMSIASGVPVPDIYVLEEESGINAFAAGFKPGDAAVAVTRGTLELLDRDELQGVIAHEFSHILNGDMRLNIRMMGVLFGIMVVGLIGRTILRGSHHSGISFGRRSKNAGGIVLVGLGLTILGWIGVFFARMIKAAVSRQREYLADASAVQFTRQTDGIANALKKIGGYSQHSYIRAADPEEVSHMLFAGGIPRMASLFSTHPPLADRIRALDPSFRESEYPSVKTNHVETVAQSDQVAGLAASAPDIPRNTNLPVDPKVAESIGQPTPEHVDFAQKLRRSIPAPLYKAAHSPSGAYLLTLALVIDEPHAERQLDIIEGQLGETRALQVREYFGELQKISPVYRLPLLEISFPQLKKRPTPKLEFLLDLARRLIEYDGRIDLREFCLYQIIARHLAQATAPAANARHNRVSKSAARDAAIDILSIVADQGHDDEESRKQAFRAGVAVFGDWAKGGNTEARSGPTVQRLEEALDILSKINSAGRQSMIHAVTRTITHDGRLTVPEAELLRAICATLDCPLPPIISVL